jgi:hypothetical protein
VTRSNGTAIYHLRSFAVSGKIIAVQRFSAETDKEALSMARDMVKGASAVARFDVWQGERRIEGAVPTMRKGRPRLKR